jgi:hypothetical protein
MLGKSFKGERACVKCKLIGDVIPIFFYKDLCKTKPNCNCSLINYKAIKTTTLSHFGVFPRFQYLIAVKCFKCVYNKEMPWIHCRYRTTNLQSTRFCLLFNSLFVIFLILCASRFDARKKSVRISWISKLALF